MLLPSLPLSLSVFYGHAWSPWPPRGGAGASGGGLNQSQAGVGGGAGGDEIIGGVEVEVGVRHEEAQTQT